MRTAHLQFALAVALVTAAMPAIAAGPGDEAAGAALFDEAKKLAGAGDFEHACPKFVEAQRLAPTTGTLLNIGNCYEKLGKLASAWGAFKEAEVMARNLNDADREQEASRRAQALAPQLAKLAINVPPPTRVPGLEVRRDGTVIGEGQWGSALPVDAGQHTIEARAPGRKSWSTWVRIETNGSSATIEVPALEMAPAESSPGGPPVPFWGGQRIAGTVVGGVGLIGLAVGAAFGVKTLSKTSDAQSHCTASTHECDSTGVTLQTDAKATARISDVALALGGAAVIGGVVLFVTAPSQPKAAGAVTIGPVVGVGRMGLSMETRW